MSKSLLPLVIKGLDFACAPLTHIVDNYIKDTVDEPALGSVVYCDLEYCAEHSGIYIGNGLIVHHDADSKVCAVTPDIFKKWSFIPTLSIYTACIGTTPTGDPAAAKFAEKKIGDRPYSVWNKNCHMFTCSCINQSEVSTEYRYLTSVKNLVWNKYGIRDWRVWKTS